MRRFIIRAGMFVVLVASCRFSTKKQNGEQTVDPIIKPVKVTEQVKHDSDDPAIWINKTNPAQSLILGTDKDEDGALYVFDLNGKIVHGKVIRNLKRPNNVDIEYGLMLNGKATDIAVVTERLTHKLRIFALPEMTPLDNGGIDVFVGEEGTGYRDLMGISMYKNPNGKIFAIVGRKNGPQTGSYLWQYLLEDDGKGLIKAKVVRKFGKYSGKKEIEAIAVDDALGYVYYSDEMFGIRKYYAEPEKGDEELSQFGNKDFVQDEEGISIVSTTDSTGYVLVSDQQKNYFNIYSREGLKDSPNKHKLLKSVHLFTSESDGSDVVNIPLNNIFKNGLFVAMSSDRTFQFYRLEDIIK